ncbi:hypothetical protein C8Z91_03450 [Paenibacillus elgii]|uniref:Uncharacterized protein n=1 Tax=Paenibacillus elgii TaxID=189691 RepID=A0A2T6G8Q3_9BACL|nr:RHS repeat-associated core domain-containing protein [Paenibacillus elgii]PUA40529.1 hypothetical protein C8Z91_03450 [Paenibacillus elgii]
MSNNESNRLSGLTVQDLMLKWPYGKLRLEEIKMTRFPGAHARMQLGGIMSEEDSQALVRQGSYRDPIGLYAAREGQPEEPLFLGQLHEIQVDRIHGVYNVQVDVISHTYQLDVQRKSRSFQHAGMLYTDVLSEVIHAYPGGNFLETDAFQRGSSLGDLVLQYEETDWEFIQRIASHAGAVVTPDVSTHAPRLWIGTPSGRQHVKLEEGAYRIRHDVQSFLTAVETKVERFQEEDFTRFIVAKDQWLELGAEVERNGRLFVVAGIQGALVHGILQFEYLCTTPAGLRQNKQYNENLPGLAMDGKILAIGVKKAKVHLDIDKNQPEHEAVWFPYSSPTSHIFHAMPPVGSRIKLYFSTHDEAEAMLIQSVRTPFSPQGEAAEKANKKMADTTVKSFSTGGGKEFELGTKDISFTAKEGALFITIGEEDGITLQSDKDLVLMAEQELSFSELKTFRAEAQEELWIAGGKSSMMLTDMTDVMGQQVMMTGSDRQSFEALSNPEAEQAKSDKEKDSFLEKLGTALDVLSMVPGLGIIAGAASAVVSICRGDFLGAALSIGSMLPIGGAAFGAAKLAAKGVAKVAAKAAAKAGGKMAGKIGRAAAKKAVQFGKNTLNKVMTGARKLKQKAEELRELLQKKLQDMQQKLAEKGKALLKKALEKSGAKKALTRINHKVLTKIPGTKGLKDRLCKWGCEPVDLITGRMVSTTTDFEFPGPLPLRWNRRWISDSSHRGLLGYGVHHSLDMRLEVLDDCIGVLLADGRVVGFERLHRGLMETRNPKERMVLRRDGTGYALCEEESRLTYYFGKQTGMEPKFRLERIGQEWEHSIALTYDGRGYLQQVTDSVGRRLEIQTDEAGRMTKVTHVYRGEQREVLMQYLYDEAGDLIAVTDAMGKTTYLSYDQHLLVKMTDRNGNTFHWHYDGPTTGARCIHTYGDDGLLEGRIVYHDGWNELTNSQGHTTTYVYTPEYYCTRMVDALSGVVHYEYSELGELLRVTDEEDRVTRYEYDEYGRIIEEVQPDEGVWKFAYREDGRLEQVTDPEGGTQAWQYDELGRVQEIVGADGTAIFFAYDERHRMSQVRNPQGAVTKLDYDEQDNLIQITLPDGTSGKWTYNHRGECVQVTDPLGAKQVFVYDVLGRMVRAELPDGNVIKLQYNAYEDVILAEDNQHRVAFGYTPLGKLAWREERGKRVQLSYNKEEELTEVINERGERYVLERDANGSIVRETGFDGVVRQYVRSPAGLLRKVERPGGRWTAYSHDVMGRVTQVEYSDGLVETFRYNRVGDILETANPFATVKLDYDRAGRVIKEWRDAYWVASQYDEMGNRTEVSSSLGAQVRMERDILGQVSQMQAQQQRGGESAQNASTPWMAQMKYDALGQEIERLLPGGVISSWQYDIAGRPERHSVNAGGRETRKRKYTWDVNNRLKSVLNELTGKKTQYGYDDFGTLIGATNDFGKIFRMADNVGNLYSSGQKTDRTYGAGGQLLEFNGTKYSYDEEGNLTEKIDPDGTHWCYQYYGNNMMSKVIRPDGQEVTFTYDSLGRRIGKHFNGMIHCYVWDGNTILHEWKVDKPQVENGAEWDDGEQPKVTQQPGQVLCPEGLITWIFEDGTFHPAAKITPEGSYSIITDNLGTPIEMYDDTGKKVWSCELDIYGKVPRLKLEGESSACPFRYPGQYEDEETGLYYNRFRYYAPHEGIYTQQDPIGLAGGLRLYGYVHDPNAWVDVFGLKGDFCELADQDIKDMLLSRTGHAYRDHIGKTFEEIKEIANDNYKACTTFFDEATALKAIRESLSNPNNARKIKDWFDKGAPRNLQLDHFHGYDLGFGIRPSSITKVKGIKESTMYLFKDTTQKLGFRIDTAFPKIK